LRLATDNYTKRIVNSKNLCESGRLNAAKLEKVQAKAEFILRIKHIEENVVLEDEIDDEAILVEAKSRYALIHQEQISLFNTLVEVRL